MRLTNASSVTLLWSWVGIAVGCGGLYFLLTQYAPAHGLHLANAASPFVLLYDSIYFSIVTMTTIGYGDITPSGFSRAIVAVQGVSGYFLLALIVTKLVAYKQEQAIAEMSRLAYEDIFRSTRAGLHLIRTDLDIIMEEVTERGTLSQQAFENLSIAYLQAQTLIQEIMSFYEGQTYVIEPRHERLLIEAVQRTMRRLEQTLQKLSEKGIDWLAHRPSADELRELVRNIHEVTPRWSQLSHHDASVFADILGITKKVHEKLENKVQ